MAKVWAGGCRVAVAGLTLVFVPWAGAGPWPAWRGPEGNGHCPETNLPLRWSATENIRWRTPLPDVGNSTPVVWENRIFLSQVVRRENRRLLLCLDRDTGETLWQAGVTFAELEPSHEENPPGSPSPVTDGERIMVWWGSAGVTCYDFSGRERWHRDLGRQSHQWGYASSPVLYEDLCLLNFGPGPRSFLIALRKTDGQTVWQHDFTAIPADAKQSDYGGQSRYDRQEGIPTVADVAGSWATPLVVRGTNGDEVVVAWPARLEAFAPRTGQPLWHCAGTSIGSYSSPFFEGDLIGLTGCGYRNAVLAVRSGGRGDVTASHRRWCFDPGNSQACVGSGVMHNGYMYLGTRMGLARCLDMTDGKTVWEERLHGTGAAQAISASLLLSGDRLYIANHNADVFVVRAAPTFECLATNSIGGETMFASLAASDGALFLRTYKQLWCVENKQPGTPHGIRDDEN